MIILLSTVLCPLFSLSFAIVATTYASRLLQLQAQELFLHLAYVRQVCFHVFILRLVHFVGEVDEEVGVALDGEALYSQCGRSLKPGEQAFEFCDVVGDLLASLKAELHYIIKLVLGG